MPGPGGDIPLRLYRPLGSSTDSSLPVLVYYHGGGWVIGDLDTHDTLCRELANGSGCAVVAVHYRLAPEHRFPAAADDSIAALQWVHRQRGAPAISTPAGSPSVATAPAAISPRWWRWRRAMRADPHSPSSC